MSGVSIYLNFERNTEEAFNFYKTVFGGEFNGNIRRYGDMTPAEGMPEIAQADKNLVMHIELAITAGLMLMGTDAPQSMGFNIIKGNNININLEPDSKEETRRLFNALSAGGTVTMELQDTFWNAYFGSCIDKFGIPWLLNFIYSNR